MEPIGVTFGALGFMVSNLPEIIGGIDFMLESRAFLQSLLSQAAIWPLIITELEHIHDRMVDSYSPKDRQVIDANIKACHGLIQKFKKFCEGKRAESLRSRGSLVMHQSFLTDFRDQLQSQIDSMHKYMDLHQARYVAPSHRLDARADRRPFRISHMCSSRGPHHRTPKTADDVSRLQLSTLSEEDEVRGKPVAPPQRGRLQHLDVATWWASKRLFLAAQQGDVYMMGEQMLNGADINYRGRDGASAAHIAAAAGRLDALCFLAEKGANLVQRDDGGNTPLHMAVLANWFGIVEFICQQPGVVIDAQNATGATPLFGGSADVTELLLLYGADPNIADEDGRQPIHRAAALKNAAAVSLLLEHGATVDTEDARGRTALWHACRGVGVGHLDAVADIIRILVDENVPDRPDASEDGSFALHMLARDGHAGLVAQLIQHNFLVNCRDRHGQTPLMLAAQAGSPQTTRELMANGADLVATSATGKTSLHYAAAGQSVEVLQVLREHLSTLDVGQLIDAEGRSPLHHIVDLPEAVDILAEQDDPALNSKDTHGYTPLTLALHNGALPAVVRAFVQQGSSPQSPGPNGLVPALALCADEEGWKAAVAKGHEALKRRCEVLDEVLFIEQSILMSCRNKVNRWKGGWDGEKEARASAIAVIDSKDDMSSLHGFFACIGLLAMCVGALSLVAAISPVAVPALRLTNAVYCLVGGFIIELITGTDVQRRGKKRKTESENKEKQKERVTKGGGSSSVVTAAGDSTAAPTGSTES
ncbi:hypothetical protein ACHAQA_000527 [Verticillium albo-atrum]